MDFLFRGLARAADIELVKGNSLLRLGDTATRTVSQVGKEWLSENFIHRLLGCEFFFQNPVLNNIDIRIVLILCFASAPFLLHTERYGQLLHSNIRARSTAIDAMQAEHVKSMCEQKSRGLARDSPAPIPFIADDDCIFGIAVDKINVLECDVAYVLVPIFCNNGENEVLGIVLYALYVALCLRERIWEHVVRIVGRDLRVVQPVRISAGEIVCGERT